MPIRTIVFLLIAWIAVADIVAAAEAVGQDSAAPAPKGQPTGGMVFEPPPVPDFMIKKPAKPLTLEEMRKQADEAAERSRRAREAGGTASPAQEPTSGSTGARTEPPRM